MSITVSNYSDMEVIGNWKVNVEHPEAKSKGRKV